MDRPGPGGLSGGSFQGDDLSPSPGKGRAEQVPLGEAAVERHRPGRLGPPAEQQGRLAAPRPGVPVGEDHFGPGHAPAQGTRDGVGEDCRGRTGRAPPQGAAVGPPAFRVEIGNRDGVNGALGGTKDEAFAVEVGGVGPPPVRAAEPDLRGLAQGQHHGSGTLGPGLLRHGEDDLPPGFPGRKQQASAGRGGEALQPAQGLADAYSIGRPDGYRRGPAQGHPHPDGGAFRRLLPGRVEGQDGLQMGGNNQSSVMG